MTAAVHRRERSSSADEEKRKEKKNEVRSAGGNEIEGSSATGSMLVDQHRLFFANVRSIAQRQGDVQIAIGLALLQVGEEVVRLSLQRTFVTRERGEQKNVSILPERARQTSVRDDWAAVRRVIERHWQLIAREQRMKSTKEKKQRALTRDGKTLPREIDTRLISTNEQIQRRLRHGTRRTNRSDDLDRATRTDVERQLKRVIRAASGEKRLDGQQIGAVEA